MTATTATLQHHPGFPWRILLAVALLAVVILSSHAVAKHGSDAVAIRRACDNGGEVQRWQALERPGKYYRVCQLSPTRFGLQIVECTARGIRERTAFVLKATMQHAAGSLPRINEYLTAKRAVQVGRGGLCP
jgi:hypothetical protein